jgi:hypothetical protein
MDSNVTDVVVVVGVTVLLHALAVYGRKKKAKQLSEYVDETGKWSANALLLEYPIGISILAIACMFVFLVIFIYGLAVAGPVPPEERAFVITTFLILAIILPWILYLEAGGTFIVLTQDGIKKRSYFTGKRCIKWDEIQSVSFGSMGQQFTVKSGDSKITAHLYLCGISDFARQIRDRLRPEIWEKARDQIEMMLGKAHMEEESKESSEGLAPRKSP